MHISKPDLNLFVVFEAIYAEGSITRAAEALHLTQPAVSHALARLREMLDDELFVRSARGVTPTPFATSIVKQVREALGQLQGTLHGAKVLDPQGLNRTFKLSVRDLFEAMSLPRLTAILDREAPGVTLNCVQTERVNIAHELASGRLDLAVDSLLKHDGSLCQHKLTQDNLVCVTRRGLVDPEEGLSLTGYLMMKHVMVSSREQGPGWEDLELARHGFQRQISIRLRHYLSAFLVVSQSDCVLTVPERFAATMAVMVPVDLHPFPIPLPPLELHLYWHRRQDGDPASRWLREQLIESEQLPELTRT